MYVVVEGQNIIAFHDNYKVCEKYVEHINKNYDVDLCISKLKKRDKYLLNSLDDLYLVRFADTYVQSGYYTYMEISANQFIEDNEYAKDVLYRLLELGNLSKKDKKAIHRSIGILEREYEDLVTYTPNLSALKELKLSYDPYFYNMGSY